MERSRQRRKQGRKREDKKKEKESEKEKKVNLMKEEKDLFLYKGAGIPRLFPVSGKYYVQADQADIPMPTIKTMNKTTKKPHCDSA